MVENIKPYVKPKLTTHGKLEDITKGVEKPGAEDGGFGCSGGPGCQ